MNTQELIRIVDGIARDKNIEREQIYNDIEQAVASGLRKQFNTEDASEFAVKLDRQPGLLIEVVDVTRSRDPRGPRLTRCRRKAMGVLDVTDVPALQNGVQS